MVDSQSIDNKSDMRGNEIYGKSLYFNTKHNIYFNNTCWITVGDGIK